MKKTMKKFVCKKNRLFCANNFPELDEVVLKKAALAFRSHLVHACTGFDPNRLSDAQQATLCQIQFSQHIWARPLQSKRNV
jgi:hypothetical protein